MSNVQLTALERVLEETKSLTEKIREQKHLRIILEDEVDEA